jgi:hypothetical protein
MGSDNMKDLIINGPILLKWNSKREHWRHDFRLLRASVRERKLQHIRTWLMSQRTYCNRVSVIQGMLDYVQTTYYSRVSVIQFMSEVLQRTYCRNASVIQCMREVLQ